MLSIRAVTEAECALACQTAAESIASELSEVFNAEERRLVRGEPPDLPRGSKERLVRFVALAREQTDPAELKRIEESALRDRAVGAVEYMMTSSPHLRESVRRIMAKAAHWEDEQSFQLNVFLRCHLNEALADQSFSKYTPAVARGELIQRRNEYIVSALSKVVQNVAEELREEPLGIPSTLQALVQRFERGARCSCQGCNRVPEPVTTTARCASDACGKVPDRHTRIQV